MSSSISDPVPDDMPPEQLRHILNYWRIEAITDQARWSDALVEIDLLKDKLEKVKAENERLRKAGDGLMFEGETMAHEVSWNPAPWDRVVAAWVAAKEGGRK